MTEANTPKDRVEGTASTRLRTFAAAALAALLFPACVVPAPPVAEQHDLGVVRAEDRYHADLYAQMVEQIQPRVQAALPGTLERQTEVWIQERLAHGTGSAAPANVKGFTLIDGNMHRGRIQLRQDNEFPNWFLTHELVHALLGPDWRCMPGVLEEGLCDLVAAELNPDCAPRIRALRAIEASIFFGKMKIVVAHRDERDRERIDPIWFHYDRGPSELAVAQVLEPGTLGLQKRFQSVPDTLYGLGFLVAQRIRDREGYEGLFELCTNALGEGLETVPVQRVLEAADMSGDQDDLAGMSFELLGSEEFEHWTQLLPDFHGELLAQLFFDRYGELSPEDFLDQVQPALILADGTRVELAKDEHVRRSLRTAWLFRRNAQR
ncbi:MAG: hypothetical protein R3F34_15325 [Planctomycetota bacterium]